MIRVNVASMSCLSTSDIRWRRHAFIERLAVLGLGLLLLAISSQVHASCTPTSNYNPVNVSFPPATVTLPTNPYAGLVFWTSPPEPVTGTTQGDCRGNTPNGLQNQAGGSASTSDDTLFPIGNTGLSYRILYTGNNTFTNAPNGVRAYGNQPSANGNNLNFDGSAQLQLVMTDPKTFASANVSSINGPLAHWDVSGCINWRGYCFPIEVPVINFNMSGVTFATPACKDPGVTVILPTVFTSAFSGNNISAGQTPFSWSLTCSSAVNIAVTFSTNAPTGIPGVIANSAGARNVGVQLMDGSCTTPIAFNTAIPQSGKSSTHELAFCARYYKTGANVSAGIVQATATYTLTYQ